MKGQTKRAITWGLGLAAFGCGSGPGKPAELKTVEQRASYAIGINIGNELKRSGATFERAELFKGITDVLDDKDQQLSMQEMGDALREFGTKLQETQSARQAEALEKNKAEGAAFLAANSRKPGITTTASGLQYEILQEGDGPQPEASDVVTVHYRGTLLDDTEFDSSYQRGEPATFAVNEVIPGWTEALQLMHVGSKYRLFVPSDLAYGEGGSGPTIGPNATLVFEVELLSIE
jgi:FKBP-type peptidyl-prolyl cis-trans isomerase FklB